MRTERIPTPLMKWKRVQAGRLHHKAFGIILWCSRLGCTDTRSVFGFAHASLVLASLLLATISHAAPAALDVMVPSASVRVGDRVTVRVTARGGEDLMLGELRVAVEAAGSWAVIEGPREVTGARPPAWELVLAPMDVGELAVPSLGVGVRDADGEAGEVEAAELPTVNVVSVLPTDQEAQPAPLRGPMGVSGFPCEWVLPLAVPVLGMAAALAWWGRRRRILGSGEGVAVLAPFDELAALLDRLDGRVGREPAESICDRLAGGLRHYLERASGEPAEEMTSFELRLLARTKEWPDAVQRGIHAVMSTADQVRFGRLPADDNELWRAIESSRKTARCLEDHLEVDDEEPAAFEAVG